MRIISGLQEAKTSRTCSDVPIGKNNKFHVRGGGGGLGLGNCNLQVFSGQRSVVSPPPCLTCDSVLPCAGFCHNVYADLAIFVQRNR